MPLAAWSDAADIRETGLSDALLSEIQHVCDEIQSAYSGKRAVIRKIREQTARRRLLLRQQERTLMACARLFVRQRLQDISLPKKGGPVIVGNSARDGYCATCGGTLRIRQLVTQISAREAGPVLSLHADCFALWDAERSKLSFL